MGYTANWTVTALAALLVPGSAALAQSAKPSSVPEHLLERHDPAQFSRPAQITNKFLPMKPGTRYIYDGTTVNDAGKQVPHRIVLNITDLVKEIAGVVTLVSYDLDYSNGELGEAELAFFAQDDAGNVWHFGQ